MLERRGRESAPALANDAAVGREGRGGAEATAFCRQGEEGESAFRCKCLPCWGDDA